MTTFVYVGHGGGSEIRVLSLDGRGTPSLVQTVPFPGMIKGGGSMPLAISPDRRLLYAGLRGEPLAVATFAIDPATGRLTHLGTAPLADSMAYLATDRTGRWLLSASYGGNKVAVNAISPDGIAGEVVQVLPSQPNAHAILPTPSNRHVLSTSLGGDVIHQWRFDAATGQLAANDPATVGVQAKAGPRHLIFSPDAKRVYLMGELDGTLTVLDHDAASGTLQVKQTVSAVPPDLSGKPSAADIHITPDGRFLYASERISSTLAGFTVDPGDGRLTSIGSFTTEKQPRGFAIDPTGHWLLAVGQLSDTMASYAIDQESGALTLLGREPMGAGPDWVEIITLP